MPQQTPWSRNADPERELARVAHAQGRTRDDYLNRRRTGVFSQAMRDKWTKIELEVALAAVEDLADELWGKNNERQATPDNPAPSKYDENGIFLGGRH